MSDKDQFTFEDDDDFPKAADLSAKDEPQQSKVDTEDFPGNSLGDQEESPGLDLSYDDDFPETDLSAAFSEGEHAIEDPLPDHSSHVAKAGGSRSRILLLVLLLVAIGGAGAYYFMDLGGTTPSVPSVPVPAQKATKSIALPAKPVKKAAPAEVKPVPKPVVVAVPPPPPPVEPADKASQGKQAEEQAKSPTPAAAESVAKNAAPKSGSTAAPVPASKPVTASATAAPAVIESTKPIATPAQVVDGAFALDAGSYLMESNRDALVAKIKKLGYEPLVTPVHATLDMTRLRLGTFGKDEVQEALDFARSIEPGAYSAPAGDGYVVYAGTFLKTKNVEKLSQRFLAEGIKVHPEPVQVKRTLNRIRFGSFATREDADIASEEVSKGGIKAAVVKAK